ncbi:D-alanyl-lipoteichoic acid biosynthesis protein DltD [Secundilactobacillus folii]|uniref:Protein DltD n=1 Tax=Secundilactobacillus folii TaxID=2678357 RepID=A0A7X3C360_9LACO|nr:D-alanyl-lipoteichoic acid biosynthesis protein DltD [Secundilactobacillus folii]MTV82291.1 D-alanyl-lipoteichoic acid biosynthesis protein DltD [Secundilactobacillus folii]
MKKKHTLLLAIAPVIIALGVVAMLLGIPRKAKHYSQNQLELASISLAYNVFKGQSIKTQAMDHGYVPFFGSSELARLDFTHPSVLAAKYHRPYRPFLLGRAGTQSLAQYFEMQDMLPQLHHRKAIVIVSPQWFTKHGQLSPAFKIFYSPLATTSWLLKAKPSPTDQYAAKRLLAMHSQANKGVMGSAVRRMATGHSITGSQRQYLQFRSKMLHNEDQLFAQLKIINKLPRLHKQERRLPATYNRAQLFRLANRIGKRSTDNNRLGIDKQLYKKRLSHGRIKHMRNRQIHYDYLHSPEYSDLELLLSTFKQQGTDVMFVIPPVNGKWARYTGLPMKMMAQNTKKIKQQLQSQGFDQIVDLSRDGNKPYFMQDTIHLGWQGWLTLDQRVKPFLEQRQTRPKLHLNNYYFSKTWQNKVVK